MSVTVNNNNPIQDYVHQDDQTQPTFEMTPGFKSFTALYVKVLPKRFKSNGYGNIKSYKDTIKLYHNFNNFRGVIMNK